MAKFTQAMCSVLAATMIAVLAGCGEEAPPPPPPPPPAPPTIGGSISGLAGGAVVLQLNGAEELSVGANGRFRFPKALPRGSAYTVTVKTQPSSPVKQTCAIGQGTGSANTPVNNVAVTCTTNSYAVGGTVSGLSGKKPLLVLELKGLKEVEIAKNGNFVFPDVRLPDGSDYNVAIKKTPSGHSCVIDAINTAPDSDTVNIVAVTCKKARRY